MTRPRLKTVESRNDEHRPAAIISNAFACAAATAREADIGALMLAHERKHHTARMPQATGRDRPLTPKEIALAEIIAERHGAGEDFHSIARDLGIARNTANNLFTRLGPRSDG